MVSLSKASPRQDLISSVRFLGYLSPYPIAHKNIYRTGPNVLQLEHEETKSAWTFQFDELYESFDEIVQALFLNRLNNQAESNIILYKTSKATCFTTQLFEHLLQAGRKASKIACYGITDKAVYRFSTATSRYEQCTLPYIFAKPPPETAATFAEAKSLLNTTFAEICKKMHLFVNFELEHEGHVQKYRLLEISSISPSIISSFAKGTLHTISTKVEAVLKILTKSAAVLTIIDEFCMYPVHTFHKLKYVCREFNECKERTFAKTASTCQTTFTTEPRVKETENIKEIIIDGKIYESVGKYEQALRCYEDAIKYLPGNTALYHKCQEIKEKFGQTMLG